MLSFLYLQTDRLRGIFAQRTAALQTKTTRETSSGVGADLGAKLLGLEATAKGQRGSKAVTEEVTTPEQMVTSLLQPNPEDSFVQLVRAAEDWQFVGAGSLVLFQTKLTFGAYGATREEIWSQFCESPTDRLIRNDLWLQGSLAEREVEMPFRSEWFTGPNAFAFLCRGEASYLEGLAVIMGTLDSSPVMLQPVAFGYGLTAEARAYEAEA